MLHGTMNPGLKYATYLWYDGLKTCRAGQPENLNFPGPDRNQSGIGTRFLEYAQDKDIGPVRVGVYFTGVSHIFSEKFIKRN